MRDADAWLKWVKERADELRAMVEEESRSDVFVNKVISAMNLPSSGVVADALGRLQPPRVVDERVCPRPVSSRAPGLEALKRRFRLVPSSDIVIPPVPE